MQQLHFTGMLTLGGKTEEKEERKKSEKYGKKGERKADCEDKRGKQE